MKNGRVVLRFDADGQVGFGHLVRSLAIGEVLRERGMACTVVTRSSDIVAPWPIVTTNDELAAIESLAPDVVVADLYRPQPEQVAELGRREWGLVCVDDDSTFTFDCDLLVNPSLSPSFIHSYSRRTEYLSGGRALILRRSFWTPPPRKVRSRIQRVLICFGGGDPVRATPRALSWLQSCRPAAVERVTVVLGRGYGDASELNALDLDSSVEVVRDADDMDDRLADADLGVLSAGTLLYEAMAVGLPSLFISLTGAQAREAEVAGHAGAAVHLGLHQTVDAKGFAASFRACESLEARATMAGAAQQLVDGSGCVRVADAIARLFARAR